MADDVLRAANPEVILASVTGFGHSGPLRNYMGYGPTTAPLSGLTSMTGHPGGDPQEAGISFGDPAAGLTAAFGIVTALAARRRHLPVPRVDVSLWEATAANAFEGWMAHVLGAAPFLPMGSRHPSAAPHGVFRCAGDHTAHRINNVANFIGGKIRAKTWDGLQLIQRPAGRPEPS